MRYVLSVCRRIFLFEIPIKVTGQRVFKRHIRDSPLFVARNAIAVLLPIQIMLLTATPIKKRSKAPLVAILPKCKNQILKNSKMQERKKLWFASAQCVNENLGSEDTCTNTSEQCTQNGNMSKFGEPKLRKLTGSGSPGRPVLHSILSSISPWALISPLTVSLRSSGVLRVEDRTTNPR